MSLRAKRSNLGALGVADPVCPNRSVVEQGCALGGGEILRIPLEGVEQYVMGERHLVHREVAFEHAAARAELLDAVSHQRSHRLGQLFRADRLGSTRPVEAE